MKKITLNHGKSTVVDDDTFELFCHVKWRINNSGYAVTWSRFDNGKRRTIFLHRLIVNAPEGKDVDHINRNPLDNRKKNLRICEHVENMWNQKVRKTNKSGTRGVYWQRQCQRWVSDICVKGKRIYGGFFKNKQDAIESRKSLELVHYGKFA